MSFNVMCESCGATSTPSRGVCPYCKSVFANSSKASAKPESASIARIAKEYGSGRLDTALLMLSDLERVKPEIHDDRDFAVLATRILLEAEGSKMKIRSLLARAHLKHPDDAEVNEYLNLMSARDMMIQGFVGDPGEKALRALIRNHPDNPYSYFFLATHLYWEEGQIDEPVVLLESCLRLHPRFLRAWACLGSIYEIRGNDIAAKRAYRECLELEPNSTARNFFAMKLKAG